MEAYNLNLFHTFENGRQGGLNGRFETLIPRLARQNPGRKQPVFGDRGPD